MLDCVPGELMDRLPLGWDYGVRDRLLEDRESSQVWGVI